jgi:hypothetical protein
MLSGSGGPMKGGGYIVYYTKLLTDCHAWGKGVAGLGYNHIVHRVPGFLSSRPNWVCQLPHSQASVAPLLGPGGHTRLPERGGANPIRTRVQTLWYSRYRLYSFIPLRVVQYSYRHIQQ